MPMMLGQVGQRVERLKSCAHDAGSGGPACGTAKKLMLMMLGQAGQRVERLKS